METILERPRPSRAQTSTPPAHARLAVATLFFVNGALIGTWVSRIPAIHAALRLSDAVFGVALLAMALGALIAMPLAGRWSERVGSHRICQGLLLVYAGFLTVLAYAPSVPLFVLALFCFGVGHGGLNVAMNAQAVAVEKRYRRPIMSSFHALFSVGGLVGAAGGGWIAAHGLAPRMHFAGAAGLMTALALFAYAHLLDDRLPADARRSRNATGRRASRFALPSAALCALGALAFCSMVDEGAMADWSALYLRRILHSTEGTAAIGYAAFSVTMAATRFCGDGVAARFGPVRVVRVGGTVALAALGLVLLSPLPGLSVLGFACVGLGLAAVCPLTFSAAGHMPGMSPGVALASVTTLGYLGFLVGPPIIGFAAEAVGLRGALAILTATTAGIVALASKAGPVHP